MPRKKKPKPPPGEIYKARRLERGQTQAEVADAAGLHQVDIHRLESGRGNKPLVKGLKAARVLDLERDDLID